MTINEAKRLLIAGLHRLSDRDEGWTIDDDNRPALTAVSEWIAAGDFRKGIALRGPVGTGKSKVVQAISTVLMNTMSKGIRQLEAVELVSTVAKAKGDRSILEKYADHLKYPHLCIEDLDTEGNAPSFIAGDGGINCVAELIQFRYKRWEQGLPLTTYFTTNADNARLFERYGERCMSRLAHMVTVVPLPGPDRRTDAALPSNVQSRIEFIEPERPAPTHPEILAAVEQIRQGHDVAKMEAEAKAATRRSEYLDDMRQRVRRMNLQGLHNVIQNDPYQEARELARNQFDSVAPVNYADFIIQLNAATA